MNGEPDIRSLTVAAAAKLLKVAEETIQAHIRLGLPAPEKRIDLIVYIAWLNRRGRKDRDGDGV